MKIQERSIVLDNLEETPLSIKNIGWTLGNECPYRCKHCYSMSSRAKGMDLNKEIIDRVIEQVSSLNVQTINVGGNEPLFTNGLNPRNTQLPYIIKKVVQSGISIGLTTSGITAIYLEKNHLSEFQLLNDVDVSFDSPFEEEHNKNRGAKIFSSAIKTLEICQKHKKDHTIVMCAMKWNFTEAHIRALVKIAKEYDANIRINMMKPTEKQHISEMVEYEQYFKGYALLNSLCDVVDMTDPVLSGATDRAESKRCPCGRTSFRIHSITPDGKIPISPCVYLHDYKVGDLMKDELKNIVLEPEFTTFRKRNANPNLVEDCAGCSMVSTCGGGCAAMSYLYNKHLGKTESLFYKDPYCPRIGEKVLPKKPLMVSEKQLVHMDYLCTWIGVPK